jgi:uncharacterized Zn finger protein
MRSSRTTLSRTDPLKRVLDRQALRRLAGATSFERGNAYLATGQVRGLAAHDGSIEARVLGTRPYNVRLWVESGGLEYSCTCPVGSDGAFCKHCVAVGLGWLGRAPESVPTKRAAKPAVTMDDARIYLEAQDKAALVTFIVDQARDDERVRQRLLLQAAKKRPEGLDLTSYRAALDRAIETDGFVDYDSMHDYARRVEETIDAVEELLKEGHAAEVIELSEHALTAVEEALNSADDSDGCMRDILGRLQELHHAACRKAKPDPEALARRLFEWQLRTDWETFWGAAETYASILGEKGLAAYRRLAQAEWARVPALPPGCDDLEKYGRRFRITHIVETLARQTGDVEAVVAVMKRDLSSPYAYLRIAETYEQARKHDLALDWAELGLEAFPRRPDPRLREFVATQYHRRKRHDEAMELVWAEFEESPTLNQYQNIKNHASRINQWPVWRDKALSYLRERIAKAKSGAERNRWWLTARADHSELVRVFLWEKDIEAAWHEAKSGGCSGDLWLQIAAKREKDHPEDALAVYQQQIEPTLARTNNEAYGEAIGLLRKIHGLLARPGREAEFRRYLESVRVRFKAKRNFLKLLERATWF